MSTKLSVEEAVTRLKAKMKNEEGWNNTIKEPPKAFCNHCNKETPHDIIAHGNGVGVIQCIICGEKH